MSFRARKLERGTEKRWAKGERNIGVKFINILRVTFAYRSVLRSFSLLTVWLCNFFGTRIFVQKLLVKCG